MSISKPAFRKYCFEDGLLKTKLINEKYNVFQIYNCIYYIAVGLHIKDNTVCVLLKCDPYILTVVPVPKLDRFYAVYFTKIKAKPRLLYVSFNVCMRAASNNLAEISINCKRCVIQSICTAALDGGYVDLI